MLESSKTILPLLTLTSWVKGTSPFEMISPNNNNNIKQIDMISEDIIGRCVSQCSQFGTWSQWGPRSYKLVSIKSQICLKVPKGLVPFTQLVKERRTTLFWYFRASDFHKTFTRSSLALNMSRKTSFGPITCHSWQENGKKRPFFHAILTYFWHFS